MFLLQSLEYWDYGPWLACMCIFLLYTRRLVCHGWGGLVLYLPVPVHRHRIDTARRYDAVTIFLIFLQYSSGCEVTCFNEHMTCDVFIWKALLRAKRKVRCFFSSH